MTEDRRRDGPELLLARRVEPSQGRLTIVRLFAAAYAALLAIVPAQGGAESLDVDASLEARIRTALDISAEGALTEARFREAVLGRFPVGSSWAEVEAKIRTLVSPYEVTRDRRRARLYLDNRERYVHCELASDFGFAECIFYSDPKFSALSLDDRVWDFEIRFGGGKAREVHTRMTSVPCWQSPDPSDECLKKAAEDCRSKGGIWWGHKSGRGRNTGCNLPTTDAGKPCTNQTQCQGACIPASNSDTSGAGCVCDRWMRLSKGGVPVCTESGVQFIHFD